MEKLRGKNQKEKSDDFKMIIKEFTRIVKKHRLSYGQTKYVIEKVRKTLHLTPAKKKANVVNRLSQEEAQKLIHAAYQDQGKYGLLIKTLFLTGARVDELVHISIADVLFEACEILIAHGKGGKKRYVPILPSLSDEIKSALNGRNEGYLFESNRNTKFSTRLVQQIVKQCTQAAGITKDVHPHLLRHSVATILRQKGMPLDLVQKFLGHSKIQTTQIYSEAPDDMMKEMYRKALG